ncbi:MAG: response regulator [Bacteroidetes bacterium]|jgi:two-component system alkaline phosphatase synthesis response regulator PhoP|nr:response regulator [Bacteroidota bacterium]
MNKQEIKILIVDDEPDIREFVSYNLFRRGYTVITAADGKEGYDLALEFKPNLIILDVLMPVMNGYETCIRLRKNPIFDQTKIIFLSALNESTAKDLGLELEADAFIGKPIRIELLVKRIELWLKTSIPVPVISPNYKPAQGLGN